MKAVSEYVADIAHKYQKGNATEHTYRESLVKLSTALLSDDFELTNEPKRQECGAPDYILERKDVPVGFIEAKDIGVLLDKTEVGSQMARYLKSLDNLILTDYLEFRFFRKGVKVHTVTIGRLVKGKVVADASAASAFASAYKDFSEYHTQTIKSARQLAEMMANKAVLVRDVFHRILSNEDPSGLHDQYDAFKKVLLHEVTIEEFADIYAETLAYGLFTARLHDTTLDTFSRGEAYSLIPRSNPFLRNLFSYVGTELDERAEWIVDALCDVFRATDIKAMLSSFNRGSGRTDPFLHFYETFLGEYNPAKKKSRGVWYTPEPVVNFIVRAVDEVLKTNFKLAEGLADTSTTTIKVDVQGGGTKSKSTKTGTVKVDKTVHRVQVLDIATGTGTFLAEVIAQIHQRYKTQQGMWSSYVEEHLIPRLHGFELLMASYAMCHMKLERLLEETGYVSTAKTPPRLNVYLTNSLQKPDDEMDKLPLIEWFTRESNEASYIKRYAPIMVAIGNPPYSGLSSNMGDLIVDIEDYKYVDGKHFGERKHWLHDDYVKFLRLGEHFIQKNGEGILGYITNHSYLDNPTFRGMRWHLLNTFDRIYIIDLHGNAKKKEVNPSGGADKNVFDIQQGVSIIVGVKGRQKPKTKKELAEVYHADVWGTRDEKHKFLEDKTLKSINWTKLDRAKPYYFFVPKDLKGEEEYKKGFALDAMSPVNATVMVTARDSLVFDFDAPRLLRKIGRFTNASKSDDEIRVEFFGNKKAGKYPAGDSRGWKLGVARSAIAGNNHSDCIKTVVYRPFDNRAIYYLPSMVDWGREKVMKHFLDGPNIGLIAPKQAQKHSGGIVTRHMIAHKAFDAYNINNVFPLYLYEKTGAVKTKEVNFRKSIWDKLKKKIGTPADDAQAVFDYIYAVLHSPLYRKTYEQFLKSDFPRIPMPASAKYFSSMAALGKKLRELHLFDDADCVPAGTTASYPISGDHTVGKATYSDGKVWINDTQHFADVPKAAWDAHVGGFQPAQKWLKDRKGEKLKIDEIKHYQKIIGTLLKTMDVMVQVDKLYSKPT